MSMGLIVGLGALLLSMFMLNDLVSYMAVAPGKRPEWRGSLRRLAGAPLLWLFLAGCAVTVLSGTRAGALTAEEGRSFFAMSLTSCCAITLAVRWVRGRANRSDES
jgi:hypothetical protein